jgi:hypothetical protein
VTFCSHVPTSAATFPQTFSINLLPLPVVPSLLPVHLSPPSLLSPSLLPLLSVDRSRRSSYSRSLAPERARPPIPRLVASTIRTQCTCIELTLANSVRSSIIPHDRIVILSILPRNPKSPCNLPPNHLVKSNNTYDTRKHHQTWPPHQLPTSRPPTL